MAEIEKAIVEETQTPEAEAVDVELETDTETVGDAIGEIASEGEAFYANIAEDMSEEVLQRISNRLLDDYKKDRVSRKDWETSYTNNLDLLGLNQREMTRPFRGSASVTHPLLSEAVTQFQAQAYKESL
jgi:hypothetical protein